jgi:uncharacterized SAM-binding protein YcdF (DUF218 family)
MGFLKSILESLGLPPVCFLYVAILGLLLARRHRRTGYTLACIGLACLTALALPVVGGPLIVSLELNLPVTPPPDAMPEAIVILGGDLSRTAEAPFVLPGALTLDRLRAGAALRRRTGLPILVTGGIVQPDRPAVATVMANSLREDFQVPVSWVENASADTWENATFSADILKKQGIRSVYVVTQGWHMRRAILAFRHTGLIVTAAPTALDAPIDPVVSDFVPRASAWGWSYYALHEWIGCAWYSIR